MDATKILDLFYPSTAPPETLSREPRRWWSTIRSKTKIRKKIRSWTPYLVIGALVVGLWIAAHLYYFNLLVDLEYNVKGTWAQVEAQLQRRYHIQQNLSRIVIDYSEYERETLTDLVERRTSAMAGDRAAKPGDANRQSPSEPSLPPPSAYLEQLTKSELNKLFPDILLVAEQYPELKLTENFQQFSQAIIDTENQIAQRIMDHNDAVNTYTTTRKQFPGNIFSAIFGFPVYEFYEPDKEHMNFEPVKY